MSDWNTLHLFDSKQFYNKIAPELKTGGSIIDTYIHSKLYWYITRMDQIEKDKLDKVKIFLKDFDPSFRFHKELYALEKRKKTAEEKYEAFIQKRYQAIEAFQIKYSDEIYFYTTLLPLILFTECAQFNPHLKIGRRIFQSNISAAKGSIAEECFNRITTTEVGGVYNDVGHVINWLTHQEVNLLWLDIKNAQAQGGASGKYFQDFKKFLKIAVENELGFLSISNVREDVLKLIENPKLNIPIDLEEMDFENVIESR